MEWNKIGLMFSLSRFKTYVNITTSTDCYLVPGSIKGWPLVRGILDAIAKSLFSAIVAL